MSIDGYSESAFSACGQSNSVFRRGHGPAVLVMHELYGLSPEVTRFASWVADAGFTVFVPCLFGKAGSEYSQSGSVLAASVACIRREFFLLSKGQSSPVCDWLRALSRSVFEELGGIGVGAVGMCLTGNFALSLALDTHLMAPVLSQPSLPISLGRSRKAALHLSDSELERINERIAGEDLKVLGLRFSEDRLCPKDRFVTLRNCLGQGFEGIEIDSSPGNAHGIPGNAHSVLTVDFVDEEGHPSVLARDRVLRFLSERLM